jgi:hypothetical protein
VAELENMMIILEQSLYKASILKSMMVAL